MESCSTCYELVNLEFRKPDLTQDDILQLKTNFPKKDWEIKIYEGIIHLSGARSIHRQYAKTIEVFNKMGYIVIF